MDSFEKALCLLVLATHFTLTIGNKLTFINKENSLVKLRPNAWRKNSFTFRVRTNGDDGNVLTVVNKNKEKLQFNMRNGGFQLNQPHETTMFQLFKHLLNDWNEVTLSQNEVLQKLQIVVNDEERMVVSDEKWGMGNWQEAWLGAFRHEDSETNGSFIGCLQFAHAHHINHLLERRSLVMNNCVDACIVQSCQNGGKCINNYRNITCDCLGTGYEGKTCERRAPMIRSKNNGYIQSKRLPVSMTTIRQVVIRMRTRQRDGILFQSNVSKEAISIELHNGSIHVEVNTARETFSTNIGEDLHNDQWHSIHLIISNVKVRLNLDQQFENEIEIRNLLTSKEEGNNKVASSMQPTIVIGGNAEDTKNFIGCLQQIYVNDVDVINSIQQNVGYFNSIDEFQECTT